MNQRALVVTLIGLATTMTACHKKPPAVAPVPQEKAVTPPPAPPAAPAPTRAPEATNTESVAAVTARMTASLAQMIHFDYDVAVVRDEDKATLDMKVAILKKNPAAKIRITGHCDERGSDDYNITLGMKRATAAKEYLVRVGIDPSRIDVSSLGREKPMDPASNEAAWARNRRDEFEVTAGGQVLQAP
jgi:peptidoglycan-associated lipoprotein